MQVRVFAAKRYWHLIDCEVLKTKRRCYIAAMRMRQGKHLLEIPPEVLGGEAVRVGLGNGKPAAGGSSSCMHARARRRRVRAAPAGSESTRHTPRVHAQACHIYQALTATLLKLEFAPQAGSSRWNG